MGLQMIIILKNNERMDFMNFGVLFAYWTHDWKGDYKFFAKKVKDLGFDILEISGDQLLDMSDPEIIELKSLVKDLGIEITTNVGPAKDKDIASEDPSIRESGIRYLTDIMMAMDKLDSRVLAGVLYSYWPCDFTNVDKKATWE